MVMVVPMLWVSFCNLQFCMYETSYCDNQWHTNSVWNQYFRDSQLDHMQTICTWLLSACILAVFFFLCFLCICAPVLYHLVVKVASIDRYSCLSGSLPLFFFWMLVLYCVCVLRRINTVCQSLQTNNHTNTLSLNFSGQMLFLMPNQHSQSTEGFEYSYNK